MIYFLSFDGISVPVRIRMQLTIARRSQLDCIHLIPVICSLVIGF